MLLYSIEYYNFTTSSYQPFKPFLEMIMTERNVEMTEDYDYDQDYEADLTVNNHYKDQVLI